jgi:hypothetical protein
MGRDREWNGMEEKNKEAYIAIMKDRFIIHY